VTRRQRVRTISGLEAQNLWAARSRHDGRALWIGPRSCKCVQAWMRYIGPQAPGNYAIHIACMVTSQSMAEVREALNTGQGAFPSTGLPHIIVSLELTRILGEGHMREICIPFLEKSRTCTQFHAVSRVISREMGWKFIPCGLPLNAIDRVQCLVSHSPMCPCSHQAGELEIHETHRTA
jgi:hypothetical protein